MASLARQAAQQPDGVLGHRDVLLIAVPIILSNVTTPLIGFVDTAVIGHLGVAHLIGGVAVGAVLFNMLYWGFGFLRMGTTGLVAQAVGARNLGETAAVLYRALLIASALGAGMIVLQVPAIRLALYLLGGSAEVKATAETYFSIRIWGAPAGLINFALLGWFIGLGRATRAFVIQLFLNAMNMGLAALFVLGLGFGVHGVASAALIAEISAALLGLWLARQELKQRGAHAGLLRTLDRREMRRAFVVNSDIMIRTFCVLAVTGVFVSTGANAGDVTLAANHILQNLLHICIYFLDGFAYAVEALVGRTIGAKFYEQFRRAVWLCTVWAAVFSVIVALVYWFAGPLAIDFMTTNADVRHEARTYLAWAAFGPLLGVWCFLLDGIYIGATRTTDMRNMMIVSLAIYLAACFALTSAFANHGLWASLMIFYVARTTTLLWRYPALVQASFPNALKSAPLPS